MQCVLVVDVDFTTNPPKSDSCTTSTHAPWLQHGSKRSYCVIERVWIVFERSATSDHDRHDCQPTTRTNKQQWDFNHNQFRLQRSNDCELYWYLNLYDNDTTSGEASEWFLVVIVAACVACRRTSTENIKN